MPREQLSLTFRSNRLPVVERERKRSIRLVERAPALPEEGILGTPKKVWETCGNTHLNPVQTLIGHQTYRHGSFLAVPCFLSFALNFH